MLVYAAIGAFGLLALLGMLFVGDLLGGDHDVGHDADHGDGGGPSFFSARVMASFLTAFGAGGVVGRYFDWPHPGAAGLGVVAGGLVSFAVYQWARLLYSQQASSVVRVASLVGQVGEVVVAIPPHGLGQVTVIAGGERTTQIARTADGSAVAQGALVTVTSIAPDSVVVAPAPSTSGGSR
jgi:membrane protein implicated in regulation of membrane protease activity